MIIISYLQYKGNITIFILTVYLDVNFDTFLFFILFNVNHTSGEEM